MTRRNLLQWLAAIFPASAVAATVPAALPKVPTPADAGFTGSFRLWRADRVGSGYTVRLAKTKSSSPDRHKVASGQIGMWLNDDDESVEKVIWRNRDGKLFELRFVPMDEPSVVK